MYYLCTPEGALVAQHDNITGIRNVAKAFPGSDFHVTDANGNVVEKLPLRKRYAFPRVTTSVQVHANDREAVLQYTRTLNDARAKRGGGDH